MTATLPALKGIDASDWAGDRGDGVVQLMHSLQAGVQEAFNGWQDFSLGKLEGLDVLPQVDVVAAAVELLQWRLSWLELDNFLRETFYSEPALQGFQVIDAHLAWCSLHLGLTEEQYAALESAVLPLAFKSARWSALEQVAARRKTVDTVGALWALAGPLPEDALSQALVTWLETAADTAGQEAFDAVGTGLSFNLPDTRAAEFLQEYALAFSARTAKGSEEKIRKVLLEALAQGWSVEETRKRIEAVHASLWQYESERIARTEIIRGHAEGQLAALDELGVQQKTWLAADDERTCPICGPRDGVTYPLDDDSVHIPAHPHCRCTWAMAEGELDRIRAEILGGDEMTEGQGPIIYGLGATDGNAPSVSVTSNPTSASARSAAEVRAEIQQIWEEGNSEREALAAAITDAQQRLVAAIDAKDETLANTIETGELAALHLEERQRRIAEVARMREPLYSPTLGNVQVRFLTSLPPEVQRGWDEGLLAWRRLVGASSMDGMTIEVDLREEGRPHYKGRPDGLVEGRVYLSPTYPDAGTTVHELGHWMEDFRPEILDAAVAFYRRRTKGEKARWLGPGYGRREKFRPDQFVHKYMGKSIRYDGKRHPIGTEIVTMGLDYFFSDPDQLAILDPEYFDFIYNLLRGLE